MSKKPLRVAIVSASERYVGGHWVQAQEILRSINEIDSVDAFHVPIDPVFPHGLRWTKRIPIVRALINFPLYLVSLIGAARRCDIAHIFSASYLSFLLAPVPAVFVFRLFRKRVILNYHSGEAEDHLRKSYRVIKRVVGMCDIFVVPSRYLQSIFEGYGFKSEVVHNIVSTDRFVFRDKVIFRPNYIVNRSLEELYNIPCILRAFRLIQEKYPEARLLVVGKGSREYELKILTREFGLHNVTFCGAVAHSKMPENLALADFFLNASNIDNMPISILEAFASGLPVISTQAGGIPFMIEHMRNGILVKLDDHQQMARWAVFLVEHQEDARKLSKAARESCVNLYSREENVMKWKKIYGAT